MDALTRQTQHNRLLISLWCALFIKCLSLEFFVVHYSVPIDSKLYVWALSIFMASVATVLSISKQSQAAGGLRKLLTTTHLLWTLALILSLTSAIVTFTRQASGLDTLLPVIAIILGCTYIAQGLFIKTLFHIITGVAWWLGAAVLFRVEVPVNYLTAAGCIFTFCLVPTISSYWKLRKLRTVSTAS